MQLRLFTLAALLTVVAPVLGTTASQSCTKALSDSVKGDLVKIQACTEALSKEFNDATAESLASTAQSLTDEYYYLYWMKEHAYYRMKEENGVANEADDKVVEGTDTADFAAIAKLLEGTKGLATNLNKISRTLYELGEGNTMARVERTDYRWTKLYMEVFIHLNTARGAEKEFRKSLEQIRSVYGDVDNTLTYTARRNRGPFRHGR